MSVGSGGGVNRVGVKERKKYFLRPPYPPPPPTTGILCSPQFRSHQETKMAARQTQRSHGKLGDCEQSNCDTSAAVLCQLGAGHDAL